MRELQAEDTYEVHKDEKGNEMVFRISNWVDHPKFISCYSIRYTDFLTHEGESLKFEYDIYDIKDAPDGYLWKTINL